MKRRIYLAGTALILAMVNLALLPLTASKMTPVGTSVSWSNEGCGCSGSGASSRVPKVKPHITSLGPGLASTDCSGCTKVRNEVQVWCNLNIICSSPPLKVRKLVRNKCWYNCGDGRTWVYCPPTFQPTYDCCSDSRQFRWTAPPCDDPGETMCSSVTPGSCD
jgi:hypothetical protein